MRSQHCIYTYSLLIIIILFSTSCVTARTDSKQSPFQITLDDNEGSTFGWDISTEFFHYFKNVTATSLHKQISHFSSVDASLLKLEATHGIWVLEKNKETTALKNLDFSSLNNKAYFQYRNSQLYDNLEIIACLYGKSFLNITSKSSHIIIEDTCDIEQQPHWKTFTVALDDSATFVISPGIEGEEDFIIIDKIAASKKIIDRNTVFQNNADFVLRETTPPCN